MSTADGAIIPAIIITKYSILFLLSTIVTGATIYIVWQRRKLPFAGSLLILLAALFAWAAGAFIDSILSSTTLKILTVKLEFIPIAAAPALMLIFALKYCQFNKAASWPFSFLWFLPAIAVAFLAVTNDCHHSLMWSGYNLPQDGSNLIIINKGPAYNYLFTPYIFIYMFASNFLLLFNSLKYVNYFRRQAFMIFFAFLIPWTGGAFFIMELNPVPGLDITPIAFILMGPLLAYAILKMGFLSSAPLVSELVLKTIDDALIVIDENEKIIDFNHRAAELFESRRNIKTALPARELFKDFNEIQNLISNNLNGRREFKFRDKPILWMEIIISQIAGSGEKGAQARLISLRDITLKKLAEFNILAAKKNAETENAAKSRFIATISHEIRTPINALTGFLDLLGRTAINEKQAGYLKEASAAVKLLLSIVNDVLDISKINAGKLSLEEAEFNLRDTVESSAALFAPKAYEKNIDFTVSIDDKIPPKLYGDPMRLSQIINNLLSNAFKFTDNGNISLACELVEESNETNENSESGKDIANGKDIASRKSGESVKINFKIKDSGAGIAAQDMAGLFKPFIQGTGNSAAKHGGTGLGLSISKEITLLMNGDISAESKIGEGSTFSFCVMLKKKTADTFIKQTSNNAVKAADNTPPAALTPDAAEGHDASDGSMAAEKLNAGSIEAALLIEVAGPRILIVEDDPSGRMLVKLFFEENKISCDIADSGAAAIEMSSARSYDIIFMDCQMPLMSGYECCRRIRDKKTDNAVVKTAIVALTASVTPGEKEKCFAAGMDDYIPKPIDFKLLFAKIYQSAAEKIYNVYGLNYFIFIDSIKNFFDLNISMVGFDSVKTIYAQFIKSLNENISAILAALEQNDFNELEIKAHKLKGLSGTLQFNELYLKLERLETCAVSKNKEGCVNILKEIKTFLYH